MKIIFPGREIEITSEKGEEYKLALEEITSISHRFGAEAAFKVAADYIAELRLKVRQGHIAYCEAQADNHELNNRIIEYQKEIEK